MDDDIGLMDYKFRFYSPTLGRFILPDNVIPNPLNKASQALNRYSYVKNNPILYNDPSGHCEIVCMNVIFIVATLALVEIGDGDIDIIPDAVIASISYNDSSGVSRFSSDQSSTTIVSKDRVYTPDQAVEFSTSTANAYISRCDPFSPCVTKKFPYAHGQTPSVSAGGSYGLIWSDDVKNDVTSGYSGRAYNLSLSLGKLSITAFSSVDEENGRANFNTVGITVGVSQSPPIPKIRIPFSVGGYYSYSNKIKDITACDKKPIYVKCSN